MKNQYCKSFSTVGKHIQHYNSSLQSAGSRSASLTAVEQLVDMTLDSTNHYLSQRKLLAASVYSIVACT